MIQLSLIVFGPCPSARGNHSFGVGEDGSKALTGQETSCDQYPLGPRRRIETLAALGATTNSASSPHRRGSINTEASAIRRRATMQLNRVWVPPAEERQ